MGAYIPSISVTQLRGIITPAVIVAVAEAAVVTAGAAQKLAAGLVALAIEAVVLSGFSGNAMVPCDPEPDKLVSSLPDHASRRPNLSSLQPWPLLRPLHHRTGHARSLPLPQGGAGESLILSPGV